MLQKLFDVHKMVVAKKNSSQYRYLYKQINWDAKGLCIYGARGTGKTTMMIQNLVSNYNLPSEALYISADHIYVAAYGLYEIADAFFKQGGLALYIDEIHKYPNWTVELKNIVDVYSDKKVIVSGSSTIALEKSKGDLSRRLLYYELKGLSFREYLHLDKNIEYPQFSLTDILTRSSEITSTIFHDHLMLEDFHHYLQYGYYPFFLEGKKDVSQRIESIVSKVITEDIVASFHVSPPKIPVIKKLLWLIAGDAPYAPNIDKISNILGISRQYVYTYLQYLEKASFIIAVPKTGNVTTSMRKPAKIYLQNPNLIEVLSEKTVESHIGNTRETFFANQVTMKYHISISAKGDFLIDETYCFEVGGKNKKFNQSKDLPNSYLALDQIETGYKNTIPLYLFGFLY